jgi:mono/diheme cytochrome c family protein
MRSLLVSLIVILAASCGPKTAPPANPTPPEPTAAPAPAPATMAFKDMNEEQKATFMKETVVPTMKPIFQAFNAEKFGTFNCMTCHGPGAKEGKFDMPNPDLPRLPKPEDFMAYAQLPEHAPWVKFMAEEVKPQMAKLLQMSEYDFKTNTGDFSCGSCHMTIGE